MRTIELNYYQGPSHGWVKAPKHLLEKISFKPTEYSYFNPSTEHFYLEEDCDATKFVGGMKAIGIQVVCVPIELKSESTIRSYPRVKQHYEPA